MADAIMSAPFQYIGESHDICIDIGMRVSQWIAHSGLRRHMDHPDWFLLTENCRYGISVFNTAFDKFEIVVVYQLVEARFFEANVIIIVKIIDPNDLIATIQQYFGAMHADKPSRACH